MIQELKIKIDIQQTVYLEVIGNLQFSYSFMHPNTNKLIKGTCSTSYKIICVLWQLENRDNIQNEVIDIIVIARKENTFESKADLSIKGDDNFLLDDNLYDFEFDIKNLAIFSAKIFIPENIDNSYTLLVRSELDINKARNLEKNESEIDNGLDKLFAMDVSDSLRNKFQVSDRSWSINSFQHFYRIAKWYPLSQIQNSDSIYLTLINNGIHYFKMPYYFIPQLEESQILKFGNNYCTIQRGQSRKVKIKSWIGILFLNLEIINNSRNQKFKIAIGKSTLDLSSRENQTNHTIVYQLDSEDIFGQSQDDLEIIISCEEVSNLDNCIMNINLRQPENEIPFGLSWDSQMTLITFKEQISTTFITTQSKIFEAGKFLGGNFKISSTHLDSINNIEHNTYASKLLDEDCRYDKNGDQSMQKISAYQWISLSDDCKNGYNSLDCKNNVYHVEEECDKLHKIIVNLNNHSHNSTLRKINIQFKRKNKIKISSESLENIEDPLILKYKIDNHKDFQIKLNLPKKILKSQKFIQYTTSNCDSEITVNFCENANLESPDINCSNKSYLTSKIKNLFLLNTIDIPLINQNRPSLFIKISSIQQCLFTLELKEYPKNQSEELLTNSSSSTSTSSNSSTSSMFPCKRNIELGKEYVLISYQEPQNYKLVNQGKYIDFSIFSSFNQSESQLELYSLNMEKAAKVIQLGWSSINLNSSDIYWIRTTPQTQEPSLILLSSSASFLTPYYSNTFRYVTLAKGEKRQYLYSIDTTKSSNYLIVNLSKGSLNILLKIRNEYEGSEEWITKRSFSITQESFSLHFGGRMYMELCTKDKDFMNGGGKKRPNLCEFKLEFRNDDKNLDYRFEEAKIQFGYFTTSNLQLDPEVTYSIPLGKFFASYNTFQIDWQYFKNSYHGLFMEVKANTNVGFNSYFNKHVPQLGTEIFQGSGKSSYLIQYPLEEFSIHTNLNIEIFNQWFIQGARMNLLQTLKLKLTQKIEHIGYQDIKNSKTGVIQKNLDEEWSSLFYIPRFEDDKYREDTEGVHQLKDHIFIESNELNKFCYELYASSRVGYRLEELIETKCDSTYLVVDLKERNYVLRVLKSEEANEVTNFMLISGKVKEIELNTLNDDNLEDKETEWIRFSNDEDLDDIQIVLNRNEITNNSKNIDIEVFVIDKIFSKNRAQIISPSLNNEDIKLNLIFNDKNPISEIKNMKSSELWLKKRKSKSKFLIFGNNLQETPVIDIKNPLSLCLPQCLLYEFNVTSPKVGQNGTVVRIFHFNSTQVKESMVNPTILNIEEGQSSMLKVNNSFNNMQYECYQFDYEDKEVIVLDIGSETVQYKNVAQKQKWIFLQIQDTDLQNDSYCNIRTDINFKIQKNEDKNWTPVETIYDEILDLYRFEVHKIDLETLIYKIMLQPSHSIKLDCFSNKVIPIRNTPQIYEIYKNHSLVTFVEESNPRHLYLNYVEYDQYFGYKSRYFIKMKRILKKPSPIDSMNKNKTLIRTKKGRSYYKVNDNYDQECILASYSPYLNKMNNALVTEEFNYVQDGNANFKVTPIEWGFQGWEISFSGILPSNQFQYENPKLISMVITHELRNGTGSCLNNNDVILEKKVYEGARKPVSSQGDKSEYRNGDFLRESSILELMRFRNATEKVIFNVQLKKKYYTKKYFNYHLVSIAEFKTSDKKATQRVILQNIQMKLFVRGVPLYTSILFMLMVLTLVNSCFIGSLHTIKRIRSWRERVNNPDSEDYESSEEEEDEGDEEIIEEQEGDEIVEGLDESEEPGDLLENSELQGLNITEREVEGLDQDPSSTQMET